MWVACVGISGASRNRPCAEFAPDKPSKEASDSEVPSAKRRRSAEPLDGLARADRDLEGVLDRAHLFQRRGASAEPIKDLR